MQNTITEQIDHTDLLNEIFPLPSSSMRTDAFSTEAAPCRGTCKHGSCMTVTD